MTTTDNRYRGGRDRDLDRLERLVEGMGHRLEKMGERVGKLERVMWTMTGLGSATIVTAIYNLVSNLQQGGGAGQ